MEFRDDIEVEILPSGPEAAGATATPRRRTRAAILVGALVLALVAGYAVVSSPAGRGARGIAQRPPDFDRLVRAAFNAMLVDFDYAQVNPAAWWGAVPTDLATHTFGSRDAPLPAGDYQLQAACAGEGSAIVSWHAVGAVLSLARDEIVPCDPDTASETRLTLPVPGRIQVTLQGDQQPARPAGFAVMITDPRSRLAEALLGPPDGPVVLSTVAGFTLADNSTTTTSAPPGRYRLSVACAGTSTLLIVLAAGASSAERELACRPEGALEQLEMTANGETAQLTVSIALRTGRAGDAAYALRLARLG